MVTFTEYITKEHDRFDLIALRFYGDPLGYAPIIEANYHLLQLWVHEDGSIWHRQDGGYPARLLSGGMLRNLPAGLVLYVPDRQPPVTKTVPPWMG